ncbi:MAG: hypothetical protein DME95_03730 [Verrucomicrobia bacterium]|nr:MAG: hypothetical protein DME95_03730 [Verrucomicrobiota bacterium]
MGQALGAPKVDRLLRRRLQYSPKAQISGGKAAFLCQRVEDNAFHLQKNPKNVLPCQRELLQGA